MTYFNTYQTILILFVVASNCFFVVEVDRGYDDRDTLKLLLMWCIFIVISFGFYVYLGTVK
jgi:hypothetical protein